jgi:hypothetical protein
MLFLLFGEIRYDHKAIDYDRTITLEVFTSRQEAKESANKLKELWLP